MFFIWGVLPCGMKTLLLHFCVFNENSLEAKWQLCIIRWQVFISLRSVLLGFIAQHVCFEHLLLPPFLSGASRGKDHPLKEWQAHNSNLMSRCYERRDEKYCRSPREQKRLTETVAHGWRLEALILQNRLASRAARAQPVRAGPGGLASAAHSSRVAFSVARLTVHQFALSRKEGSSPQLSVYCLEGCPLLHV